jgi:hypothetical protein
MNGRTKAGLNTITLGRLQCTRLVSTGPTKRRRRIIKRRSKRKRRRKRRSRRSV